MRGTGLALGFGVALVLSACSGDQREWMKINEKYTVAEFRRDHANCLKAKSYDTCMRSKGWVAVTPPKAEEKASEPQRRSPSISY